MELDGTIRWQEAGCDVLTSLLKPAPDGSALISTSACMEGEGLMDVVTLPSSGTWTVFVDPKLDAVGDLTLHLYDVPADVSGTLTVGGAAVPITISAPGQKATFTLSGTAGQQATVRITGNTIGYTTVTLKKPDGSTATSASSASTNFNLATQTLVDGTYTVIVGPSGANTGSLNLAVTTP